MLPTPVRWSCILGRHRAISHRKLRVELHCALVEGQDLGHFLAQSFHVPARGVRLERLERCCRGRLEGHLVVCHRGCGLAQLLPHGLGHAVEGRQDALFGGRVRLRSRELPGAIAIGRFERKQVHVADAGDVARQHDLAAGPHTDLTRYGRRDRLIALAAH